MDVIESWEDEISSVYAIVRHSKKEQRDYRVKEYEVMFMVDDELHSFGGSVGYKIADFKTFLGAQLFLYKGIYLQRVFPDIWLEMVEVGTGPATVSTDIFE